PFPHLVGLGPSVVRMATDAAPRWITPASRARSRNLASRPGRRVLYGVLLRSQGVLRVVLLLHCQARPATRAIIQKLRSSNKLRHT
ncbi:jg5031, partial [Pararge aegeria aegeria]